MYSRTQLIVKYLKYYFGSSNGKGHGTHSPFIFEFITKVLNDRTVFPEYKKVEDLRSRLLADDTILGVEDLGAGSSVSKTSKRSVASIAKNAAKPAKFGQLLFRVAKHYQPQHILELGTSLGITSSYLSLGNPEGKLITLEGATEVAAFAKKNLESLGLRNYSLVEGNFDDTMEAVISQLSSVDLAFVDGNHRLEPTVNYFHQLLSRVHNGSILVFDDIHWSREMEEAWEVIKKHPAVPCSIDLFFIGIVVFRKEFHEKQHFSIRF